MATWETRELTGGEVTTPGSDISAILDNLLVLRTTEEDHDLIRSIAIQKMRDSSFDTRAHLVTFSDKGLSIGAPLGKLGRSGATAAAPSDRSGGDARRRGSLPALALIVVAVDGSLLAEMLAALLDDAGHDGRPAPPVEATAR